MWVPGHEEIKGNEEADEEAAKAITEGDRKSEHLAYLQDMPISRSAARQEMEAILKKRAVENWQSSLRYQKMKEIDETLPGPSFMRTTDKIGKSETPICPACEMETETAAHFLCRCPRYDTHRVKIQRHFKRHTITKNQLLSSRKAIKVREGGKEDERNKGRAQHGGNICPHVTSLQPEQAKRARRMTRPAIPIRQSPGT